jgi:HAD superfamily hydrolase (TIGR01509 family)
MKALIFDCDGTLADTMPAHYKAWLEILRPHGVAFPETRFYALGGMPTVEIARMLFAEAGLTLDPASFTRKKEEIFMSMIDNVLPIDKVVAVARTHRGTTPMAVASGGQRRIVEKTLGHLGITTWFSAIVTSEDTTRHKPAPDVFLEAARRMSVDPRVCTVYEDTDLGIEAARSAGMAWVDVREM